MLSLTNVIAGRTRPTTYTAGDAILQGGSPQPYFFVWCATGRTADVGTISGFGTKYLESSRSSTTCFMRGLREHIEIQTSTGLPWQWRRMVITMKGYNNLLTPANNFFLNNLTSNGWRRTVNEVYGDNLAATTSIIFAGQENQDWDDPLTAKLDTSRVGVLYDRVRTVATGNSNGIIRRYKFWHAFNKNLVYNDDEAGGSELSQAYSTFSKAGMGDAIVIDVIKPLGGSATSDQMLFRPNSTLYWHEK